MDGARLFGLGSKPEQPQQAREGKERALGLSKNLGFHDGQNCG